MALTNKQINDLLKAGRDQKFRKKSEGQINADNARLGGLKAALDNPEFAKARAKKQRDNNPEMQEQINASLRQHYEENPMPKERKKRIGDKMRDKTLEEILGSEERALAGRQARSQAHLGKKRPKEVVDKAVAKRRANNSYGTSMLGKTHKDSTKSIMSLKAEIRQELKRKHGLGKNDKVPQELLLKAYKRAGLI